MIESAVDYKNSIKEIGDHDVVVSLIPIDDPSIHTAVSRLLAIIVRDLETDKTYTFPVDHPDCLFHIDLEDFSLFLQQKKYIWCFDKKSAFQLLPLINYLDVDLYTHLKGNWIIEPGVYETSAHKLIKRNNQKQRGLNNVIPLLKHQESFNKMCDEIMVSGYLTTKLDHDLDKGFLKENFIILDTLARIEGTGIHVNPECFRKHFDAAIHDGDKVYSQYNIYTSTGRPSNRFDNVNYAALNKTDGARKCFTSRFGEDGKMVLIDYSAFHPRIISYLIKFPLGIDTDIYTYLGELYLNRNITEYDMDEIKRITMRQFYGEVEEKYQHIKYIGHAKEFKEKYWKDFQDNGFIETPLFKRVITNKHLLDANQNKLFNYILQATETEVAISSLKEVIDFLSPRYKTRAVLYTYDSILFDFYKGDGKEVLDKIASIMKMGDRFPIKIYEGDTYDDVVQIYP